MKTNTKIPPRRALAAYEDAMAIASEARAWGFEDDARAMEEYAARVRPLAASLRGRWEPVVWGDEVTA